ncbi:RlpA-like double-psi beta-barrel-protein domain-containing protein-containing protein [Xylogone sp. PMI_703]|nr:RlpA-like double-psi beta-barrel-protein domain-containing protein-containing protein [Xylogone sp. PMI_703]
MNTKYFVSFGLVVVSGLTDAFPTLRVEKRQTYNGVATVNPNPTNAYGSCGVISPDSSLTVAISNTWMQGQWPSPYCGRQIQLTNTGPTTDGSIGGEGNSVLVAVEDTCMGCNQTHLDLSVAAWDALTNGASYSVVGISWQFV